MIYNNCEIRKTLKNCLVQLDRLFQWIATVENRPIEKDGTKMGSNFAKYKIVSKYIEFIQPACEAENHFVRKEYPQCAERCRNSMGEFIKYLYTKFRWQKPIGNIKPDEPSLDQLIKDSNIQNYLRQKGSLRYTYSKKSGNNATHQPFYKTDINDAFKCLSDLFYLITKSLPENKFAGTQRFDISLLENCPAELIEPQLTIEINGKEEKIPQNVLLEAVLSKEVSGKLIEANKSLINKTDVLGNTPLSLAVYNDDYETVKTLLENGADPNFYFKNWREFGFGGDFHKSVVEEKSKDKDKYSYVLKEYIEAHNCIPLIVAIKKDNVDIVKLLLEYDAKTWDSCIDDWYGAAKIPTECSTVLTCAFFYNAKKCIRYFLKNDIGNVNEKSVDIGNVNEKSVGGGVTPLMIAVENGIYVDKLLEKGAKIDLLDNYRNSVFLHAVQNMRHDYELLEKLLDKAESELSEEDFKNLLNHAGLAGCPISYMNKDEAELFLEYGADINAKNENGLSCMVDVVHLNPELFPWFIFKGAKLDFKTFFSVSSFVNLKYADKRFFKYKQKFLTEVLKTANQYDFITSDDLNFTVPIDNIPRILPLVDAILFSKAKNIQRNNEYEKEKRGERFLSAAQYNELNSKYPVLKEIFEKVGIPNSYSHVKTNFRDLEKWVNEDLPDMGSQKKLTHEEILKLPKHKLELNIDMTLEEVYKAIASVKELSKEQRIALFKDYPFIKELERRGIDLNIPEEIESNYNNDRLILEVSGNGKKWDMAPAEIMSAIREITSEIPYEDVKISPLDDALIAKNYDVAAIYLEKGIFVSELTKILLLSVHDVLEKSASAWKKILDALKSCKDIDFSDVLLSLCKNHPKDDFDIAEEFIDNGYNFYRFANYNLHDFLMETSESGVSICDYNSHMHFIENEDGTFNMSPTIEDIRKRNNKAFLEQFNETSFQDVNLRLIKNAISFGANPNQPDDMHKTALDYAKENGIDESIFAPSKISDIYEFIVDMKPSQKGAILGHIIDSDGTSVKGSISKNNIPHGKSAFDFFNTKIKVIKTSGLQTKQAGEPYYQLNFAP